MHKREKKMETVMPGSHVNNFNLLGCLMDQHVILKACVERWKSRELDFIMASFRFLWRKRERV